MSDPTARRVIVQGRVQGVFFRDSTRRRAEELGIAGWVSNRGDGAVEAIFEGDAGAVELIVDFCRRGPSRAEVEEIEVSEEQPQGLTEFKVV